MSQDRDGRVRVELGPRSYDIHVGSGLLGAAGRLIAPILRQPRVLIVTDERLAALHLGRLESSLDEAGIGHGRVVLPPGEVVKGFGHLERLIDRMLEAGVERDTAIVAFGGGAIGDLAGFAASVVLRGIDHVQIPTTLLAQVDSSVGGKTGINTRHGKNLVGSFHQPRVVLADIDVLDTLPRRELAAGYAEVVKYGLIDDAAFFSWLETNGPGVVEGDALLRRTAVLRSCAAKARIVGEDERETGRRALLNLGHTFGHAIEAESGFGQAVLHGEAVAVGMALAFELSARLGLAPMEHASRVRRHLRSVGLPTVVEELGAGAMDRDRLVSYMRRDKKVRNEVVTFVLARGIGNAFIAHDVRLEDVRALLDRAVAA